MSEQVTLEDLMKIFKMGLTKESNIKGRETQSYYDIYRAAKALSSNIFVTEMYNAQSIHGTYIDTLRYIGKDKDKFKEKVKKFNEMIKKVNNNFDEVLESWDQVIEQIKEEKVKKKNASG